MTGADTSMGRVMLAATGGLDRLRQFTPARIGLGRIGSAQPTAASLQFMLDHARARDAVHVPLDFESVAEALRGRGWTPVPVRTAAADRAQYLRRPDFGRRLSPSGRALVERLDRGCDVVIVAADGLSSSATASGLLELLDALQPLLTWRGLKMGPLVLVEQGRVAIGDEIGELLDAKLALVLIGERPGLSACDSLGAYLTWRPRVGTMDSARNCISNIRAAGLRASEAAGQIDQRIAWALAHSATGLQLNDLRADAGDADAVEDN